MNFEEAQRVGDVRRKRTKKSVSSLAQSEKDKVKIDEVIAAEERKKKEQALDFLKTRRIFKDMLDGREDLFKQCKEFLFLNSLIPQVEIGGVVTADFIAGFRYALETFEVVARKYDDYREQYGNMMAE